MGEMAEYWKDAKPYLKERRKQHVKRMGDSAIKNIKALGFEFTHYPNNHQFAINTPKSMIDYWEQLVLGLIGNRKDVAEVCIV